MKSKLNLLLLPGAMLAIMLFTALYFFGWNGPTVAAFPMQGNEAGKATSQVVIKNFTFDPATITIPVGKTITWINQDEAAHTVVETNDVFHSQPLKTGDKFTYTFTKAGTFSYNCSIHPYMKGKVIVQ